MWLVIPAWYPEESKEDVEVNFFGGTNSLHHTYASLNSPYSERLACDLKRQREQQHSGNGFPWKSQDVCVLRIRNGNSDRNVRYSPCPLESYTLLNTTCLIHTMLLACMFSALTIWHWVLVGSLGMIASPVPSFPQWPTVLCVELRLYWLFPVHSDMFVGISLVLLTFGQSCW